MCTDAEPNYSEMDQLAQKCAKPFCCSSDITRNIIPDFYEKTSKEEIEQAAKFAIKNTKERVQQQKCCRGVYIFFALLTSILIVCWFLVECKNCIHNPFNQTFENDVDAVYSIGACYAKLIRYALIILLVVFCACACWTLEEETKACNALIDRIEKDKEFEKSSIDEARIFAEYMYMKDFLIDAEIEEEISEEEFIAAISMELEETEIEEIEDVKETQSEKLTEEKEDMRKVQFEEITEEKYAGKDEVSEVEKKEFIEEEKISMESASEENYRVKKKDDEKESLIDKIDVNLFIYAMVFVFALFAICTFCKKQEKTKYFFILRRGENSDFEEEGETGETIEDVV